MKTLYLVRLIHSEQGTFGKLFDMDFECYTGELPYRNNQRNISCIPPGTYTCQRYYSKKFKFCFHVLDVPNRSWILIHSGNWCGDRTKGYKSHTYGCILVGMHYGILDNQQAVLQSRLALNKLLDYIGDENVFKLHIIGG